MDGQDSGRRSSPSCHELEVISIRPGVSTTQIQAHSAASKKDLRTHTGLISKAKFCPPHVSQTTGRHPGRVGSYCRLWQSRARMSHDE